MVAVQDHDQIGRVVAVEVDLDHGTVVLVGPFVEIAQSGLISVETICEVFEEILDLGFQFSLDTADDDTRRQVVECDPVI